MKRACWLITLATMLAILLGGCGGQTAQEELPLVRYVNFRVFDPVYVAIDKGFFEDHGIQVEIVGDVIAGPNAIQAVSGGSAEAALSSVPALINANAAGLPVQGVADIQTTFEDQHLQRWFVLKDSPIQSLADVEGKRYAVNIWRSSFHYTSLRAMDAWGVDEDAVDFQLLSFANQIPALVAGEVDVIGLIQPYQSYLEADYGDQVRELWNDYDLYGEKHVSLIFVNRVWAKLEPEQARAFVAGIRDAIAFIEEHPDEMVPIVSKYTQIPEYAIHPYHFTPNGEVQMDDIEDWIAYLRQRGDLTADWVTAEMVGTNEYQ